MLTRWRSGGLEDVTLSDSDYEDEGGDSSNGELTGGYTTHKAYEAYVPLSTHHNVPGLKTSGPDGLGRSSNTTRHSALTPCSNIIRSWRST